LELTVQQGRGSMGSKKHGKSGRAPRSPRYKMKTLLDARKEEQAKAPRPTKKMYDTVSDAFDEPQKR
jgi:hypothetical protein